MIKNHSWSPRIEAVQEGETVAVGEKKKKKNNWVIFTVPMNFLQILWHDKKILSYQPWGLSC